MNKCEYILSEVRKETNKIILFTSLTGKDSILLTHYCSQIFEEVIAIYMYVVKDLQHVQKFQHFFEKNYSNIKYYHVPHFMLSWYIRSGFMGIKKDKSQKKYQITDIDSQIREKTGIGYSVYGMKMNDCLNRRLQMKQYRMNAICDSTHKIYPLSEFTNAQVLALIEKNNLPYPVLYNNDKSQSQDITDIDYLLWLFNNYPEDLERTFKAFPDAKHKFYEETNKAE